MTVTDGFITGLPKAELLANFVMSARAAESVTAQGYLEDHVHAMMFDGLIAGEA